MASKCTERERERAHTKNEKKLDKSKRKEYIKYIVVVGRARRCNGDEYADSSNLHNGTRTRGQGAT